MADGHRVLRCAVYTRKSTDEGLEQDFNSLQAQREACEAFIRSQRSEGWKLIPAAYDDGGISGGTMERPALKRLMAEIEERHIDVVVVYKVDRLTRSLSDFSKMVEVFDRYGVSFVAVTQQFNTTTSMGRLTLNVLLSFAQFEREVTAERIRDKIAASKRKGMWMGGALPRGYRVVDRKLVVVPDQAEVVNHIYRKYLDCPSLRELSLALKREGIVAVPKSDSGVDPGPALSRGALYGLLRNPIYVGLIAHKGELHPGLHEGIVDRRVWDAVQEKLKASHGCRGRPHRKTEESPLLGKLFDAQGRRLIPTYANKKGKRYRYYVSQTDHLDEDQLKGQPGTDWRLPAREIEARIGEIVAGMVADRAALAQQAGTAQMNGADIEALLKIVGNAKTNDYLAWVDRVGLHEGHVTVEIRLPTRNPMALERTLSMVMKRRGVERRMVIGSKTETPGRPEPRLVRALSLGLRFWEQLNAENPVPATEFARREGCDNRYIGRTLPLAFLAPDIMEWFVAGRQPPEWTAERVIRLENLPVSWVEQRKIFGVT